MRKGRKSKGILRYDPDTKMISMDTDGNITDKFKLFLERNKIYFETVLMLVLTITGIVVSVAGVKVGIVANSIAENENKISDLEKQPTFVMEKEMNGSEDKYIIRNTGGDIKYGNLFLEKAFVIHINDENYTYLGSGYIILGGDIEHGFSAYDFDTKSFTISSPAKVRPVLQWSERIESIIREEGCFCGVIYTEHLDIQYQDYKQDFVIRDMVAENGLIRDFVYNSEYSFKLYVNVNNIEDDQIGTDLKREIELLKRYNT